MFNLNQYVSFFLAALLTGAAIIAGVNAVEISVNGMIAARKDRNTELCFAKVAQQNPGASEASLRILRRSCKDAQDLEVENNYKAVRQYIACFKDLVNLAASTAPGTEPSSSSVATCNQ